MIDLERLDVILAVLVGVMLIVGAWLITVLRAHRVPSVGLMVVVWVLATGAMLLAIWLIAFVACSALLFTLGTTAAAVGVVVAVILLEATPVATGLAVRRWAHHR